MATSQPSDLASDWPLQALVPTVIRTTVATVLCLPLFDLFTVSYWGIWLETSPWWMAAV